MIRSILLWLAVFPALLLFTACQTASIDRMQATSLVVDDSLRVDSSMIRMTEPYRRQLDSTMKKVIGYSGRTLEKGTPESLLGNFLCDALYSVVTNQLIDSTGGWPVMVLLNNGGIRSSLPKGEITVEHLFMVMPFDNELILLEIKGSELIPLFDLIATKGGMPVGGLRLILHAASWSKAEIGGELFSPEQTYILATSDYLANGGDGLNSLKNHIRYVRTGLLVRDLFIRYISTQTELGKEISPVLDGRISYE